MEYSTVIGILGPTTGGGGYKGSVRSPQVG